MPSRELKAKVDITGLPQFLRLVRFLSDAEDYARETADYDLMVMVDQTREDLARMMGA